MITRFCGLLLLASAALWATNHELLGAEPRETEKFIELDMIYTTVSSASLPTVAPGTTPPTIFVCTVDTTIDAGNDAPDFDRAYVMGSARNDYGSFIYPDSVAVVNVGGTWNFVFSFTSVYGSKRIGGVAKYLVGDVRFVANCKAKKGP